MYLWVCSADRQLGPQAAPRRQAGFTLCGATTDEKVKSLKQVQLFIAAPDLLAALQAQDDLERLRWLRDNFYPEQGSIHGEWDDITARYAGLFIENDGWGWIIMQDGRARPQPA